jgi:hypothetical protein
MLPPPPGFEGFCCPGCNNALTPLPATSSHLCDPRSATEGLKITGESFPWKPAPNWDPPRRVPAGGVNETWATHTGQCGGFSDDNSPLDGEHHSTYVYLRANHKVERGGGARELGTGGATDWGWVTTACSMYE